MSAGIPLFKGACSRHWDRQVKEPKIKDWRTGTIVCVLLSTAYVKTQPGLTERMVGQSDHILRGMLHQWPHGKETASSSARQKPAPTLPPMAVRLPENVCGGS